MRCIAPECTMGIQSKEAPPRKLQILNDMLLTFWWQIPKDTRGLVEFMPWQIWVFWQQRWTCTILDRWFQYCGRLVYILNNATDMQHNTNPYMFMLEWDLKYDEDKQLLSLCSTSWFHYAPQTPNYICLLHCLYADQGQKCVLQGKLT